MATNRIYTRKTMGLDKRVWFVMLAGIIIPLGLLSYRLIDKKECIPIDFTVKSISGGTGNVFIFGETIIFKASTISNDVTWDFQDNSPKSFGKYVIHKFRSPGNYLVKASTGPGCEEIKQIVINSVPVNDSTSIGTVSGQEIIGPVATIPGKEELFTCMVSAGSYEWSVVNYPKLHQTGITAQFTFPREGTYTVQVTLDNDRSKRFTKEILVQIDEEAVKRQNKQAEEVRQLIPFTPITVIEKPVKEDDLAKEEPVVIIPPKEAVKKKMFISNETFFSLMEMVLNNQKDISDFNQYLFSEGATKVQVKGEGSFKTFSWLYQELKGKNKKLKLKSIELIRDENEHVINIKVEYKKRSLMDRVF